MEDVASLHFTTCGVTVYCYILTLSVTDNLM